MRSPTRTWAQVSRSPSESGDVRVGRNPSASVTGVASNMRVGSLVTILGLATCRTRMAQDIREVDRNLKIGCSTHPERTRTDSDSDRLGLKGWPLATDGRRSRTGGPSRIRIRSASTDGQQSVTAAAAARRLLSRSLVVTGSPPGWQPDRVPSPRWTTTAGRLGPCSDPSHPMGIEQ